MQTFEVVWTSSSYPSTSSSSSRPESILSIKLHLHTLCHEVEPGVLVQNTAIPHLLFVTSLHIATWFWLMTVEFLVSGCGLYSQIFLADRDMDSVTSTYTVI